MGASIWIPPCSKSCGSGFSGSFPNAECFSRRRRLKSSGIGSSIFHFVDDGFGSCSRRHEGEDFVCSVRFLVYVALGTGLEDARIAISGSKMYMLWFLHDSASGSGQIGSAV